MVTIVNYSKRMNSDSEEFFTLILQSDLELVRSRQTGRFYATSKKVSLPTTFDEPTCKSLIGHQLPGSIKRIECDPYEFAIPETGEVIHLAHRYEYSREAATMEETVLEGALEAVHE